MLLTLKWVGDINYIKLQGCYV